MTQGTAPSPAVALRFPVIVALVAYTSSSLSLNAPAFKAFTIACHSDRHCFDSVAVAQYNTGPVSTGWKCWKAQ